MLWVPESQIGVPNLTEYYFRIVDINLNYFLLNVFFVSLCIFQSRNSYICYSQHRVYDVYTDLPAGHFGLTELLFQQYVLV